MSIFSSIGKGLDKFGSFILNVFTKTSAAIDVLQKVGPGTLAAILAVFYDLMKFLLTAQNDVANIEAGNITGTIQDILSIQTRTLLAKLVTDVKAAESAVVNDLQQLGIIKVNG